VIASGALLLSISSKDLPLLQTAFQKAAIPIQVIGKVRQGPARVLTRDGGEIKPFSRDEILKVYES
jgi:hypothetical protein